MSTLYIDRSGLSLSLDGLAIVLRELGKKVGSIPIASIDSIVIKGNPSIEASVLGKLGECGKPVTILYGRKNIPTIFSPGGTKDGQRRLNQYRQVHSEQFCLAAAKQIIKDKLASQIQLLKAAIEKYQFTVAQVLTDSIRQIESIHQKIDACSTKAALMGLEGASAGAYFSGIASILPEELGFKTRQRRPPRDPFNAVISLGYTLLYSEATLVCIEKGLDPYIGFLHEPEHGRYSLTCDVMEEFRSQIDELAIDLFLTAQMSKSHFDFSAAGCFLNKEGRAIFYPRYQSQTQARKFQLSLALDKLLKQLTEIVV